MVPVPVAVKVTEEEPVTLAPRAIEALVPVPRRVTLLPLSAPATVMEPALLLLVNVKSLTLEAFRVIAEAASVIKAEPVALTAKTEAVVVRFKVLAVETRLSEPVLAVLFT